MNFWAKTIGYAKKVCWQGIINRRLCANKPKGLQGLLARYYSSIRWLKLKVLEFEYV